MALFFLMLIYFWDNVRDRVQPAEGQTERDTESEAGSRLWDVSPEPDMGLELTNREIMTWANVGHLPNWATQVPHYGSINVCLVEGKVSML